MLQRAVLSLFHPQGSREGGGEGQARRRARDPCVGVAPNKSKQNQIDPDKKAWICLVLFVRIGTFQWVTANPNKKISAWRVYDQAYPWALRLSQWSVKTGDSSPRASGSRSLRRPVGRPWATFACPPLGRLPNDWRSKWPRGTRISHKARRS
jgi:hypothetical protein